MKELLGQVAKGPLPRLERARRETKASADLDPGTAMPRRARIETQLEIELEGMATRTKHELDEYEFDWQARGVGVRQ